MGDLLIPNTSTHNVVSFKILIEGTAVDPSYQILHFTITKEVNRIPSIKMVIRDGDAAQRKFEVSNTALFIPGKKIQIDLGLDGNNATAFKGIITRHSVRIKENGNTELSIEAKDEAVKMTIGRKNAYYSQLKDSDLMDQLIKNYKTLTPDTKPTKLKHKEIVQHHITDWDLLLLRAEANGMMVLVNDGTVKVCKPDTTATPVLNVSYGFSIMELEAEMDALSQWSKVEAVSWDYANQQLFKASATEASQFQQPGNISGADLSATASPATYQLHHSGHLFEQELQDWVDGQMLKSRMSKIRGRAKVTGYQSIKPGDVIQISGLSDRFNGTAYVTAVRQDVVSGSWDTHIQFGLTSERYSELYSNISDPPASGLIGAIQGLQIGKVVQLQKDPDGEFRILVKIPVIDNKGQGTWTRVASLDAGKDRGAFFMPEIGDEVIVGFINNDPRHAIMLGMVHSSQKAAPIQPKDVNHEKGFTTRSKMHIHFNDQTKTITIDTPAGNKVELDENGKKILIRDQNKNSITMDSSGISMESPQDITIKATNNLTLKAGASLSVSAMSIDVSANASLKLSGASASLQANGIAQIQGSLVKIN